MNALRHFLLIFAALPLFAVAAHAEADPANAESEWDPASTTTAPCGSGEPDPGHAVREIRSVDGTLELTMIVKQDGPRLCYVVNDNAEAPVLRVVQGDRMVIHLVNGITDVAAINSAESPKKLDKPNTATPHRAGFIPVIPGMYHPATGRTNLHLHGFPIPPTVPQDEVMKRCADPVGRDEGCGGRAITYELTVPPTMPAGVYWYHPHIHGEAEIQVEMGLSGALVVEGQDDIARSGAGIEDRVLMVRDHFELDDDPKDEGNGAMMHGPALHPAKGPTKIDVAHQVQCSEPDEAEQLTLNGSVMANGKPADGDLTPLAIAPGRKQLWRIVNATADSFLDLALVDESGHAHPVEIVARDGMQGIDDAGHRLAAEMTAEPQLVPPAGRLELLVAAPAAGAKQYLVSHAVDTGCAGDADPERVLALVTASPGEATVWPAPAIAPGSATATSPFYVGLLAHKADRVRTIAFTEYPRPGSADSTDFYMTEIKPGAEMVPFHMDAAPTMIAKAGSVEEWVLENWTQELHAFHIHQVHFRVLEVNGVRASNPPLLDVVNIPYAKPASKRAGAPLVPGKVRIKLVFPAELAGNIPFHCHLMEHEDNGMMGFIRIVRPQTASLPSHDTSADLARLLDPPVCRAGD